MGKSGSSAVVCATRGEAGATTVVDAVRDAIAMVAPHVAVSLDDASTPLYLQCLPRSLMDAWVRHRSGDPDASAYVDLPEIGTPDEQLTTIVDTTSHLWTRDRAIAEHASQTSPFDGLPEELRRGLAREHLVRVNPP